ncbi:hypothetical protein RclHR1_03110008 [Rhizophagus clarus]|uniref:Cardiolipin synthase N-terminal domain-containing protein n=1 Tax=Rhizophagus clarus TaxID=94130 RepID=A0A2Z6S0U9_9GLOM|nr:hypothetical protein RclHR1_03110008 [Rhizophagus clarus]
MLECSHDRNVRCIVFRKTRNDNLLFSILIMETLYAFTHCDHFMGIKICVHSLFFLAIFILDGLAIIEIIKSKRRDWDKLLWVFLILFFQIFGLIAYFFLSDRKRYKRASWYQNIP